MLVAANFDGHSFIKTGFEEVVAAGFSVGATVVVAKRFTVEYDPVKSKNLRADVTMGTELSIKGYARADADKPNSKPRLVFSFSHDFGKKHGVLTVDVAIDDSEVKLPEVVAAVALKHSGAGKQLPYLTKAGDTREIHIIGSWTKRCMNNDASVKVDYQKAGIKFVLDNIVQSTTSFSDADLLIVKRNCTTFDWDKDSIDIEVWTLRKFEKHELVLVPETTQVLCQHFTGFRSAIAKNMDDAESKSRCCLTAGSGQMRAPTLRLRFACTG